MCFLLSHRNLAGVFCCWRRCATFVPLQHDLSLSVVLKELEHSYQPSQVQARDSPSKNPWMELDEEPLVQAKYARLLIAIHRASCMKKSIIDRPHCKFYKYLLPTYVHCFRAVCIMIYLRPCLIAVNYLAQMTSFLLATSQVFLKVHTHVLTF